MVKFDKEGQGFWEFILENCSAEFIEIVEREINMELSTGNSEIVDVKVKKTNHELVGKVTETTVYMIAGTYGKSVTVYQERQFHEQGHVITDHFFMPYYFLEHFQNLGVI